MDNHIITLNSMRKVLEIALVYNDKKLREIVEGMVERMNKAVAKEPELEQLENKKKEISYII